MGESDRALKLMGELQSDFPSMSFVFDMTNLIIDPSIVLVDRIIAAERASEYQTPLERCTTEIMIHAGMTHNDQRVVAYVEGCGLDPDAVLRASAESDVLAISSLSP